MQYKNMLCIVFWPIFVNQSIRLAARAKIAERGTTKNYVIELEFKIYNRFVSER